jgi:hypothetical protein
MIDSQEKLTYDPATHFLTGWLIANLDHSKDWFAEMGKNDIFPHQVE